MFHGLAVHFLVSKLFSRPFKLLVMVSWLKLLNSWMQLTCSRQIVLAESYVVDMAALLSLFHVCRMLFLCGWSCSRPHCSRAKQLLTNVLTAFLVSALQWFICVLWFVKIGFVLAILHDYLKTGIFVRVAFCAWILRQQRERRVKERFLGQYLLHCFISNSVVV